MSKDSLKSTFKPKTWDATVEHLWLTTIGDRKWFGAGIVIFFFLIPASYTSLSFYLKIATSIYDRIFLKSIISPEEENIRNEWVAVISYWTTEKEARDAMAEFKNLYSIYETTFRGSTRDNRYPVWRDDIVVARDPENNGRWIIAIDTYYGPSSQPAVSAELARITRLGGDDPSAQNTFRRKFVGSKALCYSQVAFEKTYGKIDPAPQNKIDQFGQIYLPCEP